MGYIRDVLEIPQLKDMAIDCIVDMQKDNDSICEYLHQFEEEQDICANTYQNLTRVCVIRYLKSKKE